MTRPGDHGYAVRGHRAPLTGTARRLADAGRRLGVGALVIAAVAVGGVIKSCTPDTDRRERPFIRGGAAGAPVDARTFDVTVLGVRGAATVARSRKVYESGGIWVLVRVRLVAHTDTCTVSHAAVRDPRGRTYLATERFDQPLAGGRTLQPGVPAEGEIVFEVPVAAAPGLAIRLSSARLGTRMDAVAEVPLGVDRAMVDRWQADQDPTRVEDAEVVP